MRSLQARPTHGLFYHLGVAWAVVLDWVFPPQCAHCGRIDVHWCEVCTQALLDAPLLPLSKAVGRLTVYASGTHEGVVQSAIHALKYYDQHTLATPLAQRFVATLDGQNKLFDTIISVPLHPSRQAKRGYNQANLLASALAEQVSCSLTTQCLMRTRDTRPQVGLDRHGRLANVQDAFTATPEHVAGQRILLVDDVCTTGATLLACADALYQAGAQQVDALTLTFAKH